MNEFYEAGSVAIIGVSNSPVNLARVMVYNMIEFRCQARMQLVGPKGGAFLGHAIYASVEDMPDSVDLASILVPARAVPDVLRQCGKKGVKRIVLQSAGFRELGEERIELEEEVLGILSEYGMRMIGPNCIGIINRRSGLAVPFMAFRAEAPPGRVAVLSQSGGVGAATLNALTAEKIGFSKFASVGNKLDVNENDLLEYFIQDDETDVIFCYLEGIAQGRRLMDIAFRSPKPILINKSNTGSNGAVIARSHSASLSSDDRVVDEAFKQCGILRLREQSKTLEMLKVFSLPPMRGNRLAILSRSGGHGVIAADAAEEAGFDLPGYPEDLLRMVERESRAGVIQFHNPLDLGDLFNMPLYGALAEKALAGDDFDGLVLTLNYQGIFDAERGRPLIAYLEELFPRLTKPLAFCVFTTHTELEHIRKSVGFPIFTDPGEAVRALAASRDRHGRNILPFPTARPEGVERLRARAQIEKAPAGPLPPEICAAILDAYGVPLVPWKKADNEDEALHAARRLGFPVALKTANPAVLHKSDAGAVHLDIADEAALVSAYRKLQRMGDAVLVEKMADKGVEWMVGGRQDEHFGAVLVAGLGGIYVEALKETGLRVAPIDYEQAERLLADLRGASLLDGVRGQPPVDRRALLDVMVRVSWLLADFPEIEELDLNPVRAVQDGCFALDWRALKKNSSEGFV